MNPIAEIGQIVRRHDRLLVVDCISTLGVMPFSLDELKADVAVTASQKGLMSPTGISFAAVNQRAWAAVEKTANPSFTVDFKRMKKFYDEKRETPGSTPVSLVASVNASLELIFEEGLQNVFKRHAAVSRAIKSAVQGMGLTLLPEASVDRSHAVTLIKSPDGINPSSIKTLAKEKYGIMIGSGLGELQDTSFRIGHIGMIGVREALLVVSALELILRELGVTGKPGNGLDAFYESLNRESDDC
jgi:aspartate aminotransferase-like enzyme